MGDPIVACLGTMNFHGKPFRIRGGTPRRSNHGVGPQAPDSKLNDVVRPTQRITNNQVSLCQCPRKQRTFYSTRLQRSLIPSSQSKRTRHIAHASAREAREG